MKEWWGGGGGGFIENKMCVSAICATFISKTCHSKNN